MPKCEYCRNEQTNAKIHKTKYGDPCCVACARQCKKCKGWVSVDDHLNNFRNKYCGMCQVLHKCL